MKRWTKGLVIAVMAWLIMRLPQFLGYMSLKEHILLYDAFWVPLLASIIALQTHLPSLRDSLVRASMRHSKKVLLGILIINAIALPGILRINLVRIFDASDLPSDNALVQEYKQYSNLSMEENSFVVTLTYPSGITSTEALDLVLEIENTIKGFEGVDPAKVFSFASIRAIRQMEEEYVEINTISAHIENSTEEDKSGVLHTLVATHPLINGRFVDSATTPTIAVIQATFSPHADLNKLYNQVMNLIGVYAEGDVEVSGLTQTVRDMWYRLLGVHNTNMGTAGFVFIDIACLISILFVAVVLSLLAWILMLLFLFRNFHVVTWEKVWKISTWTLHTDRLTGVIFTLTVLMLTPIFVVMGGLGWAGITVDTLTGIIPIVFIVIASSAGIHLVHYIAHVKKYLSEEDRILQGIRTASVPMLMASLTTAIGFITLYGFEVQSIAKFGIYSALGVGFVIAFIQLFISPAWFIQFPLPKQHAEFVTPECKPIISAVQKAQQYPRITWSIVVGLVALSALAIPDLHIGSRPTRFLDEQSVIPQTTNLLNEHFGANGALFIAIDSHAANGALESSFLQKQEQFSEALAKHHLVAYVQDVAQIIRYMHEEFIGCDECSGIPNDTRTIQELLFLYEDSTPTPFLKNNNQVALMNVWGDYEKSNDVEALYAFIHQKAEELGLEIAVGSEYVLWMAQTEYLVVGKIISWVQSYLLILLLAVLFFGNIKASVIVTTPLAIVTIMVMGAMSVLNIPLDISSTVITSITIGIGADFSIHIFNSIMRKRKSEEMGIDESITVGIEESAPPIIYDAQTNMLGFATFLFASLLPVQHCGIMLIGSMALASFGALVLIPLLIRLHD